MVIKKSKKSEINECAAAFTFLGGFGGGFMVGCTMVEVSKSKNI